MRESRVPLCEVVYFRLYALVFMFVAAFATDFSEAWVNEAPRTCPRLLSTQSQYDSSGSNDTIATWIVLRLLTA